jgi:glutaconate CoA-transferase subunit B
VRRADAGRAVTRLDRQVSGATGFTTDEMMTVAAARELRDGQVCFVGIGLPSAAANLARATHAPGIVLVYESGTIGAKPTRLPLSIGDGELAETADSVVAVPEIFNYWLQGGRIDVGMLGAAQVDRFANLNTTVIGDYDDFTVRLPGSGGAPEIAGSCHEVVVVMRQSLRTFVPALDFVTTVGFGSGPGDRAALGLRGRGPTAVVTDLGILRPNPASAELTLAVLHPGVDVGRVVDSTGWPLVVSPDLATAAAPSARELEALRSLRAANASTNG